MSTPTAPTANDITGILYYSVYNSSTSSSSDCNSGNIIYESKSNLGLCEVIENTVDYQLRKIVSQRTLNTSNIEITVGAWRYEDFECTRARLNGPNSSHNYTSETYELKKCFSNSNSGLNDFDGAVSFQYSLQKTLSPGEGIQLTSYTGSSYCARGSDLAYKDIILAEDQCFHSDGKN